MCVVIGIDAAFQLKPCFPLTPKAGGIKPKVILNMQG
jgi:hypothetical protein